VVLRGLRQRAELNGRFGHVLDVVNANTADAKRWAHLQQFERGGKCLVGMHAVRKQGRCSSGVFARLRWDGAGRAGCSQCLSQMLPLVSDLMRCSKATWQSHLTCMLRGLAYVPMQCTA
jgi:hypothetical protein